MGAAPHPGWNELPYDVPGSNGWKRWGLQVDVRLVCRDTSGTSLEREPELPSLIITDDMSWRQVIEMVDVMLTTRGFPAVVRDQ